MSQSAKTKSQSEKQAEEKYWWVKFSPKAKESDENDVTLSVNGESLKIGRDKEVPLPDRFLECADHTLYPQISQEPGKPRKTTSWIKTFPYEKLREATEEDFKKMKESGTKETHEHIQKYGVEGDLL